MSARESLLYTVVVIVNADNGTYYEHHFVASFASAYAFADGMIAAWKISHGPSNCWRPLVLVAPDDRAEWEAMGSPGLDEIQKAWPK